MRKNRLFAAFLVAALVLSATACQRQGTAETKIESSAQAEESITEESGDESKEAASDLKNIRDAITALTENNAESYAYDIAYTLAYDPELQSTEKYGWRMSGSEAEHRAADYIAKEMNSIGLEEVEKVPITVDSWEFKGGSLTIEGTDLDMVPYPYATNGTDEDGITAQIVDVGTGTMDEYEGLDVKNKIVLVGVDQINEQWIDVYMDEADLHGAAAIVTYPIGKEGYATLSDDDANVHDVCDDDLMPCVSVSRNEAKAIQEAIAAGNDNCTLKLDNKISIGDGIAYNVMGKIKGRNSDQMIVVSAHYDKYFWGFQDDCTAFGVVMGIAKSLKDSGYVPQNDICFIAHAAEEWGTSGSQSDYTTGGWEMINTAHPEWQGKIIGMLNFELAALYDGAETVQFEGVPEYRTMLKTVVAGGFIPDPVNNIFPGGISYDFSDAAVREDGISYRLAGTPYFINVPGEAGGPKGWYQQRYHTFHDDKDTYNADVMATNINTYGALAIYIDSMPALQLDFTASADAMADYLDEEAAEIAETDLTAYKDGIEAMRAAGEEQNAKIKDLNDRYIKAVADGAADEELEALYTEGRELNAKTLKAFRYVQDNFIDVIIAGEVGAFHSAYQANVSALNAVIAALNEGNISDGESGALDIAYEINYGGEYGKYYFSKEVADKVEKMLSTPETQRNYATGRGFIFADTGDASRSLIEKAEEENPDVSEETKIYETALEAQKKLYKEEIAKEADAMKGFAETLK